MSKQLVVPEGIKVATQHIRPTIVEDGKFKGWESKGGMTVVDLWDEAGNCLATGTARCSRLDNYNRKLGRTIALGRALKALES